MAPSGVRTRGRRGAPDARGFGAQVLQFEPAPEVEEEIAAELSPEQAEELEGSGSWWQRAALWVFKKALGAFGIDPGPVLAFLHRAGKFFFDIVSDLSGFVGNLVAAIRLGFEKFAGNLKRHLLAGLAGFLAGSLLKEGISPPKDLSPKSILLTVFESIGLTPGGFRERLGKRLQKRGIDLGPLERAWGFLSSLLGGGMQGLVAGLLAYAGNLKAMLVDSLLAWLSTAVLKKGLEFIAALALPGAGAVRILFNVVGFLKERAGQIAALFRAVMGTVGSLAKGDTETTANKIEATLARLLPVAIGFLAGLLGIGDLIAKGVKKVLGGLGRFVDKAFDAIVGLAERTWAKLFGKKTATQEGAAEVDPRKAPLVEAGLKAIDGEERRYLRQGRISKTDADEVASAVKARHSVFRSIDVVDGGDTWDYRYVASPTFTKPGSRKQEGDDEPVACDVEGKFGALPRGKLGAKVILRLPDAWWLGNDFRMNAEFRPTNAARKEHGDRCGCQNGIFRQYLKGKFVVDGNNLQHRLPYNKTLKEEAFEIDGPGHLPYGDRTWRDGYNEYLPDLKTGGIYRGGDEPHIKIAPDKEGEIDLTFKAKLHDVGRRKVLAESPEWSVQGRQSRKPGAVKRTLGKLFGGKRAQEEESEED